MPRSSAGTYSLPGGNPVVTGTTISSTVQNTTLADVATELSNSLDRNGRGQMVAPLALADGSASAPGLTFNAEPTTGLYRATTNDLRIQVGATTVQQFLPTGPVLPLGLTATQTATNASAIVATGNGTGPAATFTGGPSGGTGLIATGQGGGTGIIAVAGSGNVNAILSGGNVLLNGPALSSTTLTATDKSVTYANIARAAASFTLTGATGAQTINASYNITSVLLNANTTDIDIVYSGATFATGAHGPAYWLTALLGGFAPGSPVGVGTQLYWRYKTATGCTFQLRNSSGTALNLTTVLAATGITIDFRAEGY